MRTARDSDSRDPHQQETEPSVDFLYDPLGDHHFPIDSAASPASIFAASPMESEHKSAMEFPSIRQARESALSRAPPQVEQATSRMYPSICSRCESDSASWWRRRKYGRTTFERGVVGSASPVSVLVANHHLLAGAAIEQDFLLFGAQRFPLLVHGNPVLVTDGLDQATEVATPPAGPWMDGALGRL